MYMVIFQLMWIHIKFGFVHNKLKAEIACFVMQRPNHYDNIKQNMTYDPPPPEYIIELRREVRKSVFRVFDKVRHKPGCTTTENG